MGECANLKNLYSERNTYNLQDVQDMKKLKKIYREGDIYQHGGPCLIECLFRHNKLEYVSVKNATNGNKIVGDTVLLHNIESLS